MTTAVAVGLFAQCSALEREAQACGGLFCDGVGAMPVDQTGENVIFVHDGDQIETHVQILYSGDAERFAWLLPLSVEPEFDIGSEVLFDELLSATAPSYGFTTEGWCGGGGDGDGDGDGDGWGEEDGEDTLKVTLETVGAFDIALLSASSSGEVIAWLEDNEYEVNPLAAPILQEYLDEGHVLAAAKLTAGASVEEIHPLVIRSAMGEPCIPLRLTSIAAEDDMAVRVFVLADQPAAPTNFDMVELNPIAVGWLPGNDNYEQVVASASDERAGAFAIEYSGPSCVADQRNVLSPLADACAFADMPPTQVIEELRRQEVYSCDESSCEPRHSSLTGLLHDYLPVPEGVDEEEFYGCLECYAWRIDRQAWDGDAFAVEYQTRILDPAIHAAEVLHSHPHLTRMTTVLSADEMTRDPVFHLNDSLEDRGNIHVGNLLRECPGAVFTFPDGRDMVLEQEDGWTVPEWPSIEGMSPVERAWKVPFVGPPQLVADNRDANDAALSAWNDAHDRETSSREGDGIGALPACSSPDELELPECTPTCPGGTIEGTPKCIPAEAGDEAGCGCSAESGGRSGGRWFLLGLTLIVGARWRRYCARV